MKNKIRRPLLVRGLQAVRSITVPLPSLPGAITFRRKWLVSVGRPFVSVRRPLVARWSRVRLYQPTSGPYGGSETLTGMCF